MTISVLQQNRLHWYEYGMGLQCFDAVGLASGRASGL